MTPEQQEQLRAKFKPAPICACHGEPKTWHKDRRLRAGGGWICAFTNREWYARNRTELLSTLKSKRAANREAYNSYQRAWRAEHPVRPPSTRAAALAAGERYRRRNPEVFAEKERRRRSWKRSNGGSYTLRDWRRLLARYDGLCAYCGDRPAETVDHVIPVSRGGSGYIGNILPACLSCNSSKQDRLLVEWRRRVAA